MNMFCYQCQEAAKNSGCTTGGVCGKKAGTSGIQDVLIYGVKGLSWYARLLSDKKGEENLLRETGRFIIKALFMTITNANFDDPRFITVLDELQKLRNKLEQAVIGMDGYDKEILNSQAPAAATWTAQDEEGYRSLEYEAGILREQDEDSRSLKELIIYGLKGIAAYGQHALVLGYEDREIYLFIIEALSAALEQKSVDDLISLVMKTGEYGVKTMALLDKAHTETYGNPEVTSVSIGVRGNPGILISGHDLRDMEELLKQTQGTGVDVYTHSEMLPAHYYPAFKKYPHFAGNYGNAWWKQDKEFAAFNGAILMTTNCIVPVRDSYKERIWTTGEAGYPGVPHIPEPPLTTGCSSGPGGNPEKTETGPQTEKDFSPLIDAAQKCPPPEELEQGEITGGFAHAQVLNMADKIVEAVTSGAIKRFVVMAGCDGRQKGRNYYTEVARELPQDTVILTAGCAKYRYNKLELGDINGIPRVLDAGQCNDSYSLALTALKLKEVFEMKDVNDLPISFDIAWYEQKAVIVLLALLNLGFKGLRVGPTLPAFLSPNVVKVLVENFGLKPIGDAKEDVAAMMAGK